MEAPHSGHAVRPTSIHMALLTGLLQSMADEAGIDLWKLPYEDARPQRLQWLAENAGQPPMAKNPRAMKVGRGCSTTLGRRC